MTNKRDKVSKKVRDAVTDAIETWECGDCKNTYGFDVKFCPNDLLDGLIVRGLFNAEELR